MSEVTEILDRDSDAVLRAFWRRIYPHLYHSRHYLALTESRYRKELPDEIPAELRVNMRTALCALNFDDLTTRLTAAEADAERLDWLEECPYWVTVQTQPHGDFIHSGSGHGIRAAIDAARGGE